jgi:eukaryotic-like serine/threonine-protein kinase
MSKDRSVKPGDVLGGKYRVERVLGEGGMGLVVAARHVELRQRVAVKVLKREMLDDGDQVERFMREARAAVRLRSEHSARVTDVGRLKNGAPFMVMELLTGEDLGQALTRGPLAIATAVDYVLQACEAIAEAHAFGVIHRDIKPGNLYLTRRMNGQPLIKVLDFGLAKQMLGGQDKVLTRTTAVMGSPQYMSPEQLRASRDVDARTDIWSIGACLYELLTTQVPFDAPTVAEPCALVLTAPPRPIAEYRAAVPPELWSIIARCLEKEPVRRYRNVAELTAALERFGSAASHGASERVAAVLFAAPALPSDAPPSMASHADTRTEATFDSTPSRPSGTFLVAAATAVAVAAVAIGAIAMRVRSLPTTASTTSHVVRADPPPPIPAEPSPTTADTTATAAVAVVMLPAASASAAARSAASQRPMVRPHANPSPKTDAGTPNPSSTF